jgi:hypothetical protein
MVDLPSSTAEVLDGLKEGDIIIPDWRVVNDPARTKFQ